MHRLRQVEVEVDKLYPGLGRLAAFVTLVAQAKVCALVIAPQGCGKSEVARWAVNNLPHSHFQDKLSAAGLVPLQGLLNDFESLFVMDDLGKAQTPYARLSTALTLAELTYSGFYHSDMARQHISIDNFRGSAVLNCQPIVYRDLAKRPEWEATLLDKTIRYYHLRRPIHPRIEPIEVEFPLINRSLKVAEPAFDGKLAQELIRLASYHWSTARVKWWLVKLLKVVVALDGREQAQVTDYQMLMHLLKPCFIERHFLDRQGFEATFRIALPVLYMLCEFSSYKAFRLEQLARNYKMSDASARRALESVPALWQIVDKNPTLYGPSERIQQILNELGG